MSLYILLKYLNISCHKNVIYSAFHEFISFIIFYTYITNYYITKIRRIEFYTIYLNENWFFLGN